MKTFRDNGAIGALLDEYEKAILELGDLIEGISSKELCTKVDSTTKDLDCISIQSILSHVLRAGYRYAVSIKHHYDDEVPTNIPEIVHTNTNLFIGDLENMFKYTEVLFTDYPEMQLEEHDPGKKIKVSWGQYYDVEQLMEHAIVHILRHRRQIERFLIKLRPAGSN